MGLLEEEEDTFCSDIPLLTETAAGLSKMTRLAADNNTSAHDNQDLARSYPSRGLCRNLQNCPSRQFTLTHTVTEVIQVIESGFRENWMHKTARCEVQCFFYIFQGTHDASNDVKLDIMIS